MAQKVLHYQQWLDEMSSCPAPVYQLSDAVIQLNAKHDVRFKGHYFEVPEIKDRVAIKVPVILKNVTFSGANVTLQKLDFHEAVVFNDCRSQGNIFIRHTTFKKPVTVFNSDFSYLVCGHVTFSRLSFIRNKFETLSLEHCQFKPDPAIRNDNPRVFEMIQTHGSDSSVLGLANNHFLRGGPGASVLFSSTNFALVSLMENHFEVPVTLGTLNIKNQLRAEGNQFDAVVDSLGFQFPAQNSWFSWDQLQGKLAINPDPMSGRNYREIPEYYQGINPGELADHEAYRKLRTAYANFYFAYKSNLDTESANSCYVELKDLETRRLRYLHTQNPNFRGFFAWQINVFLKKFSDYGTNPPKAIVISGYVILIFALFFFFFPNDWDTMDRNKLIKRMETLITYFRSPKGLTDLYESQHHERYLGYEAFKQMLERSQKELPFYFSLLAKPLYRLSTANYRFSRGFLQRAEILNGKWADLKGAKRWRTATVIGIYLAAYLLYALTVKMLNAITLSINTFTTLGFGDIPTRGLARYAAIAEGFIGWFMLTLFSVSMINQILQ